ncbi:TetR/AcrR family transcriptional regulator [Enterococcus faecalis]|uniref:TetR/AcrR family transcriptional regulator n=1 Tax=Enterococcus faecalis TaxID=1351 RepID=UPI000DEB7CD3|nr:TetR/AcrR family transcriptional regulator [Enterococcus faecalis]EHQ2599792.1 TetR/AcrR family transcriptional regulator [Enterococcus faecalis]EHZ5372537.1 TetR/AcrR family transcriptional regulator [Enterococcus faecalis]EIW2077466.1 TetR/AcrR family transcriptional regulator [Enterococcus faecalis]EJU8176700.1 TetR/AcrR family transcriptional regulator [Enterococcus faecalis]EKI2462794.1 TetR/AcrR family transcriptional regulator [Enterococcus faecalis]
MKLRNKIIEDTVGLIYRKGYRNTSIRDIIEKSNIGKGQFYYYFSSKKEIGIEVINYIVTKWRKQLFDDILSRSASPQNDVIKMLDWVQCFHEEQKTFYGCPVGNLITELSNEDEDFRLLLEEFIDEWINHLANKLIDIEKEEFNEEDAKKKSIEIIAAIQGSAVLLVASQNINYMKTILDGIKLKYIQS